MAGIVSSVSGGGVSRHSDAIQQMMSKLKQLSHDPNSSSKLTSQNKQDLTQMLKGLDQLHNTSLSVEVLDTVKEDLKTHLDRLNNTPEIKEAFKNVDINHLMDTVSKMEGSKDAKFAGAQISFISGLEKLNTQNSILKDKVTSLLNSAKKQAAGGHGSVMDVVKNSGITDKDIAEYIRNLLSNGIDDLQELMVIMGMLGGMVSVPESLMSAVNEALHAFVATGSKFSDPNQAESFKKFLDEVAGSYTNITVDSSLPEGLNIEVIDPNAVNLQGGIAAVEESGDTSATLHQDQASDQSSTVDSANVEDDNDREGGVYGGEVNADKVFDDRRDVDGIEERKVESVKAVQEISSIIESKLNQLDIQPSNLLSSTALDQFTESVLNGVEKIVTKEANGSLDEIADALDDAMRSNGG